LSEIDAMMPWEKHVYVELLNAYIKEQEDLTKQKDNEYKNMMNHLNRRKM
jgi:hypothetical protein